MTTIDPKRAKLVLPNGDEIPLRKAMAGASMSGHAPTVLISNNVTVEPAPIRWRLEGFAPEVIIAPVEPNG